MTAWAKTETTMSERNRMPRRVARAGLVALIVALALAGCVGIPKNGGVNVGPLVGNGAAPPGAELPVGPPKGASRDEILTDFMQAVVSPESDYGIARLFLTKSAAKVWDPTKSVLIRDGTPSTDTDSDGDIVYTVATRASINDSGIYSEQSTESSQSLSFSFSKVDGQWRISALGDGVVLSRNSFTQYFSAQTLYFFDPTYRYLVPDVRWFPTGSTAQTRVVSALLGGPAPVLQGGVVVSAFPQGTRLQKVVDVRGNTATIDLSSDAAAAKPLVQSQMLKQLQESLLSTTVTNVDISVGGAPLQIPQPAKASDALAVDPAPLVRKGKQFGFWPQLQPIDKITAQVVALDAKAVSLARDQKTAAVLGKNGVYLVGTGSAVARQIDSRKNLIAPSIDPFDFVWSVPSNAPSEIRVTGPDGQTHSVTSTVVGTATSIVALQVSHDGARVMMYLKTTSGPRLLVAGVLRRAGNIPTSIGTPLELPVSSATPIDATWVDSVSIAALGETDGQDTVVTYPIGGPGGDPSTPIGAVHIVGGSGEDQLRVLTSGDEVYQLRSSGWQDLGIGATVLGTQQ
jgi:hypothetical protein